MAAIEYTLTGGTENVTADQRSGSPKTRAASYFCTRRPNPQATSRHTKVPRIMQTPRICWAGTKCVTKMAWLKTVPVRYGVNILEAGWGTGHVSGNLVYEAELADCGEPGRDRITFFAYEWINPRPGIRIREIRLKGSSAFQNVTAHRAPQNTIMLAGVSVVTKRMPPNPMR